MIYYNGAFGLPKDYSEAAKWFQLAADQGVAGAENSLGYLYEHGMGVAQNYATALDWYRKAADQQDSKAEFNLALMYEKGIGVPKDQAEAIRLLRMSAIKGFSGAQITLGAHYMAGNGVGRDLSRAYFWSVIGAAHVPANESALANGMRDAAARQLSPDEVTRIQGLALQWKSGMDETTLLGAAPPPAANPGVGSSTPDIPAGSSTGTGILVSKSGFALTNAHVLPACKTITGRTDDGETHQATLITRDERNDLALFKLEGSFAHTAAFRDDRGIRAGDDVVVYGFPLAGVLSSQGTVTTGTISALAGMGNDTRLMQISAPLQPGNSGGPVVDKSGDLVGVAVSKLNALALAKVTGDVAQNVNFAIKASVARDFLDANSVVYATAKPAHPLSTADLAERMKAYTVLIACVH
jgi:S1-C subfamily serine protease